MFSKYSSVDLYKRKRLIVAENFYIESLSADTKGANVCEENNSEILLKQCESLYLDIKSYLTDEQLETIKPLIENFLKNILVKRTIDQIYTKNQMTVKM